MALRRAPAAALLLAFLAAAPARAMPAQPGPAAGTPAGGTHVYATGDNADEADEVGNVLSAETRDYVILFTIILATLAAGLADVRTRRRRGSPDLARALAVSREEVAARTRQVDDLREELRATCVRLDDAVRASESKTRFIGHVSHEFRTPLSSIIGFASLLSAEHTRLGDEKRAEYLEIVLRNSRHLLHVINDILNLSKVEAGTLEVSPAPVYVPEAVAAVVASLSPLAAERRIRVETDDRGRHFAVADSGRLRQVVQNVLENALKYAPEGTTVRVEVTSTGYEVRIDVRDEGPGIAAADQERLFKEFSRLNLPGVRVSGAGLGLALSKQLVELMGGRIGVDSAPGQGSDFWVALPAGEEIGARIAPTAAPRRAPSPVRRGTVAVVDDDPDIRAFAAVILEDAGYRVLLDDGREGTAQRVCGDAPDVVLLDLHLEGRGGIEALAELRACQPLHGVPIIAFTASGTPDVLARIREARFDGQLLKPVEPDSLLRCVDAAIADSRAARGVPGEAAGDAKEGPGVTRAAAGTSTRSVPAPAEPPEQGAGDADPPELRSVDVETDDEADYLAPLRERFRAGLPDRLGQMRAAIGAGDRERLTREVHKLRGAAAGYGLDALSTAAGHAEEALRRGADAGAPSVASLLRLLDDTIGAPPA